MNPVKSIRNSFYSTAFTLAAGIGALTSLSGCGGGEDDPQPVTPAKTEVNGRSSDFGVVIFDRTLNGGGLKVTDESTSKTYTIDIGTRDLGKGDNATLTVSEVDVVMEDTKVQPMDGWVGMDKTKAFIGTIEFNANADKNNTQGLKKIRFSIDSKTIVGLQPENDTEVQFFANESNRGVLKQTMREVLERFNDNDKVQSGNQRQPLFVNVH